jgi:uncharacterized membrane protein YdfJ with MMPL/SSD domain
MQAAMDRLSNFVSRRKWLVLGAWVVLLLASLPFFAQTQKGKHLTAGGFEVPGSGALAVAQAIPHFPGVQSESLIIVFDNSKRDKKALLATIDRVATKIQGVKGVSVPPQSLAFAGSSTNKDTALMPLTVTGNADQVLDIAAKLRTELDIKGQQNAVVPIHLVGEQALWATIQEVSKTDLEKAEFSGFPIVLLVLLAVFGSLAAALLPLSLGIAAVVLTGGAVFFVAEAVQMSVFVTNISSMLGIGVAVDYSLFVLSRYREEISSGVAPDDARRAAMRTSGIAVAISGVTVMVALAGLFVIDSTMLRSMAIGAIIVVAIAVLAAVTLLPALITLLGPRAYRRGRVIGWIGAQISRLVGRSRNRQPAAAGDSTFWQRWTAALMRHPVIYAALAVCALLVIALPALSLKTGTAALLALPTTNETRVGFDEAATALGPGALGPIQVVADFGANNVDRPALSRFEAAARGMQGVVKVAAPLISNDGHSALIVVTPTTGPEDPATVTVVKALRAPDGPAAALASVATVDVGGVSAANKDFNDLIFGSLWKLLVFVLLFSYLVLLVMLRSVILPLKAVLMNVLSVAAAYGVLVVVFQWGWTDGLIHYHHLGYVNSPSPPLILAIVFGLSMDYEVFLLSRIRERYHATHDNRTAVAEGLAASAKTISSAALIMVLVFAVFALAGLPLVKEIGVGLGVAVFLDATLVRLVLVPATMELMGEWNWWLPGWLDRLLPNLDFESSGPTPEPRPVPVAK